MALKVRLNTNYPYNRTVASYYDSVTGVNLTINNPESGDLTGLDLTNIIKGIEVGNLVISEGTMPEVTYSIRVDKSISIFDGIAVASSVASASSAFDIGGSVEKSWFIVTDEDFDITIELSPDGTNWFTYRTENVNNEDAIISHSHVAKQARVTATNNGATSGNVTVILYERIA